MLGQQLDAAESVHLFTQAPLACRSVEASDLEVFVAKEGLAGVLFVFLPSAVTVRGCPACFLLWKSPSCHRFRLDSLDLLVAAIMANMHRYRSLAQL